MDRAQVPLPGSQTLWLGASTVSVLPTFLDRGHWGKETGSSKELPGGPTAAGAPAPQDPQPAAGGSEGI